MSKKDDYIYSYIDKEMIDTKEGPKFDSERYKKKKSEKSVIMAIIVGSLLGVLLLAIMIMKDIVKDNLSSDVFKNIRNTLPYTRNELIEEVDELLNTSKNIVEDTNKIINDIATAYSNKDFSEATKNKMENTLAEVKKHNLDSYTDGEYQNIKTKITSHINLAENCFDYYKGLNSQSNEASNYLNNIINEKMKYIKSYDEDVKSTITNAGLEYEILENGSIKFY
ncbi:hypothetical protein [Clostridium tertium]|uniref:Uncharacterized protein n=1 Tax=Clostridium tertium TaxID=1559 RepID=A0A6N2YUB1_9CLOT